MSLAVSFSAAEVIAIDGKTVRRSGGAKAAELRLKAAQIDPDSQNPVVALPQKKGRTLAESFAAGALASRGEGVSRSQEWTPTLTYGWNT